MKKARKTCIVTILLIFGLGCGHIPTPGERVLTPVTTPIPEVGMEDKKAPETLLFGYPWPGYKIKSSLNRFHLNFNIVKAIPSWQLAREIKYTAKDREYRFTSEELQDSHVRVVFKECDSIADARENILMAQLNISGPPPEKNRPDGFDFGDVYSRGHWARDNIYMYVHDMSNPNLSTTEIIQFQKAIDNALCTVPEVTGEKTKETPEINTFFAPGKIKLNEPTPLMVVINNSDSIPPEFECNFFATGGQIFMNQNTFFYQGVVTGKQSLKLYVTNPVGLTSMKQLVVEVK